MRKSTTEKFVIGALLSVFVLPLGAAQFDFYKLGRGLAGGDFLPTDGIASSGGDLSSSNVNGGIFNGDLTFQSGGITAVATGTFNGNVAAVVQDKETNWTESRGAGLGVYSRSPLVTSDDNITRGEVLTITFDRVVSLTSIGLRAEGHNYTGWGSTDRFMLNGVSTLLPDGVGTLGVNLIGKSFTFGFDSTQALTAQFYLASMTVSSVPEGGATLSLFAASLFVLGVIRRRR